MPGLATQPAISELRPYLYIAGTNAISAPTLRDMRIAYAIDATSSVCSIRWPKFEYLKVPVHDHPSENIAKYFEKVVRFVDEARRKRGKVIVYCAMGRSRSVTLCIAYLMAIERRSAQDVYDEIKRIRPCVCLNPGFWKQLQEYEGSII